MINRNSTILTGKLIQALAIGIATTLVAPAVFAQDRSLFEKTSNVKDYGKRDRVFLSSDQTISPSQMHELYGMRGDAGIELDTGVARYPGEKAKSYSPTATARAFWSGDIVALGLGGSLAESQIDSNNAQDFSEQKTSRKFLPSIAATVLPNVTVGIASDVNWIQVNQNSVSSDSQTFDTYIRRESIGASFHTPKWEAGIAYASPATASATSERSPVSSAQYGLFAPETPDRRDFYLPSHITTFARGNLTDQFSMQGALTHVQYDNNVAAAKETFDVYRQEDRLAAQLQAVYWLQDRETRLATTAIYKGATYAEFGTEDVGLGYRDVNLYGLTVDGAVSLQKRTYLGLSLGYMRGERDQQINGRNISVSEEHTKIATTINMNL